MKILILAEHEITIHPTPDSRQVQRVITYQVEDMAPRTLWIDAEKLADRKFLADNPKASKVPAAVQAEGDKARRMAIEADVQARKAQVTRELP